MKTLYESNIHPKKSDIFQEDSSGNFIYHIFKWDNGYIVNDKEKQNQLLNIEGYRAFFYSYKPPIMIPIIVVSFLFGIGISFIFKTKYDPQQLILLIAFVLYVVSCFLYYLRIRIILRNCPFDSK